MTRFELVTSCSQGRRANQAALHPAASFIHSHRKRTRAFWSRAAYAQPQAVSSLNSPRCLVLFVLTEAIRDVLKNIGWDKGTGIILLTLVPLTSPRPLISPQASRSRKGKRDVTDIEGKETIGKSA